MSAEQQSEANLVAQARDTDPVVGLPAVAQLRRFVEESEAIQIDSARTHGWSWQEIGAALGVSKQAAHHKHGRGGRARRQAKGTR
jgi:hypothetical protein